MRLPIATVLALLLAGCGSPRELAVERAWIRLPAAAGRPAVAYATIRGGADKATLVAVTSPAAIRTELHESMTGAHNMATMAPLAQIDVPAGATVTLAPGGKHVMLFDVSPTLRAGESARLSLQFAEGRTLTADAQVLGAGDPPPK